MRARVPRAMAMRVVGNKEGNGDGSKSDGDGNYADDEKTMIMTTMTETIGIQNL
jgi:hypothetical protein